LEKTDESFVIAIKTCKHNSTATTFYDIPMNDHPKQTHPGLAIAISNVGHLYTHMFTILYATAVLYLPQVFDLTYGELLTVASLGLILYGVAALPAGWLGDRWSQVGMLVIFFFGLGAGTLITGFAGDTDALFVGLTVLGLFASIYHPVGIAWLVANARKQGIALGLNGVFGNVGSALAPVFVGLMIDYVSWRAAFVIPGIIAVVTGLALTLAWWRGWVSDVHADRAPPPPPEPGAFRRVLIVLTITMTCNGFVYTGLMNTVPKVFESGLGEALAGNYTEIGLFAGAIIGLSSICSVIGGWLADRYSPRSVYLVFWLLSIPPLLLITSMSGLVLLFVALLAFSFNVSFAAAENMLVARYTPFEWRSLAYGARFVLALGIGGLTVGLAGDLFDATGSFDMLYLLFAAAAIIAAIGAALLPGRRAAGVVAAAAD
jgi:MFS family permease